MQATPVKFVMAVNTKAGCYGIGSTAQIAVKNCNRERSWMAKNTKPEVFYYFGNCERSEIHVLCGADLQISWPPTAVVMRRENK